MPGPAIRVAAKSMGTRTSDEEVLWKKAKKRAAAQGHENDYAYIMGVYKASHSKNKLHLMKKAGWKKPGRWSGWESMIDNIVDRLVGGTI